jgi:hypothetical protein
LTADARARLRRSKVARRLSWLPLLLVVVIPSACNPNPCAPPVTNPIACENTKPGTPEGEWDNHGPGDPTIVGFTTDISANVGSTIAFKIDTPATAWHVDVFRLGYYQGNGARKITTLDPSGPLPQAPQPACLEDPTTGLVDCGNWSVSLTWDVPGDAVSGLYLARLVRDDTGGINQIPFVVRNDASHAPLYFQTSDTTWQAYNTYGGNSLYQGEPVGRAYKVSYNRPFDTRESTIDGRSYLFSTEYPMIRFLEANGYDIAYSTDIDTDRYGSLIQNHRVFMSVGHDEYWSGAQRANVEAARDAGVNLAFFSGNSVYWKTRWETSIDGSGTPYRTLVSYKETHANAKIDPSSEWTGTWRDPRFSPPADGGRPENALTGTLWTVGCCNTTIDVPAADGQMRIWRNTSVATQAPGETATLAAGTLGYEWDEDVEDAARPPGLIHLSTTTRDVPEHLVDFGNEVEPGTATHHLTLYRAPSGALVFGAGTVQWAWGLDGHHDGGYGVADVRMQQATVNLLADMGVQPRTLQAGLVAAIPSLDTTPPTAVIASPTSGASVTNGTLVNITGTASDLGGPVTGVVGGVEVSTDGGATWHAAQGRESWTYSWIATGDGPVTLLARATDDSVNTQTTPASVAINVSCPCSIFGAATPTAPQTTDTTSVELGVRFHAERDGLITGLRFYKGPDNGGVHTGSLWTNTGTLLATATYTSETAEGWQTVTLPSPVPIAAGTTYIASYFAPEGHYAADFGWFAAGETNAVPLHAPQNSPSSSNGIFRNGAGFPNSTYQSANYWVDVIFEEATP